MEKSINCTYKVRFLKNRLVSFSEVCDWVKDLTVPRQIIWRYSPDPQQTEAPHRNEKHVDLQMGHSSSLSTNLDGPTQDPGAGPAEAVGLDGDLVRVSRMVGTSGTKHKLDIAPEPTRRSKRLQTTANK